MVGSWAVCRREKLSPERSEEWGVGSGEWRSGEEGGKMIENRLSDDRL